MNSSENIREVTLASLITKNRVTLKEEIVLQYQLSIEEKRKIKIENEISRISDYFIKYLDVNTHFFISKNTTTFLNIDESSIRFIKSASNVQMMKKFCELIRDSAINKRWIKFKKFRITAEQSIFLLMWTEKSRTLIIQHWIYRSKWQFSSFTLSLFTNQE
jgi:hypothetical protein